MSENEENRPRQPQGFRPTGPTRVGRIGDWNNSSGPASSSGPSSGRRIATLGGMGGGPGVPGSHDDDSDDEDGKKGGETWFSGGERSGINVQNPETAGGGGAGGLISSIFRQATENSRARAARGEQAPIQQAPQFAGGGYTLGSDEEMSRYIPDSTGGGNPEQIETRFITFWRNGFTVADGELRDYETPESRAILARIMQGDAPMDLLNVGPDQEVDLQIANKRDEDYTPPPQPVAFRGSGNRLGAPVPSAGGSSSQAGPPQPTNPPQTSFEVDQTQPTTNVQIRFADGSKMVAKMNLTHTVGDIRGIINASQPVSVFQPYVISTTFPNRTLDDNSATIEAAGLKNSVVVQRWAD